MYIVFRQKVTDKIVDVRLEFVRYRNFFFQWKLGGFVKKKIDIIFYFCLFCLLCAFTVNKRRRPSRYYNKSYTKQRS